MNVTRTRRPRESGQVILLFALLLPVLLGLGSIVISVGNWYVHKKHLQTLVDAGALAAGTEFTACFQNPVLTNDAIAQGALEYSGDTLRDPATRNLQEQEPDDVRAVLNSSQYWAQTNGMDPTSPSPGYGLDYSLPHVDGRGNPTADSYPCSVKFLDVKATDDEVPLLFRWLPAKPSPKSRARVEILQVLGLNGLLPWAVPEVDPARVGVVIVNEDFPATHASSVRAAGYLNKQSGQSGVWAGDIAAVNLNGGNNFGAVIVVSKDPGLSLTGTLDDICTQNLVQTRCYSGNTTTGGLNFIRAYPGGGPLPAIREVQLADTNCGNDSAPYFALTDGCRVQISKAVVDFGSIPGGDPTVDPTCARVTSSPGGALQWVDDGGMGYWQSTGSFSLSSGRNVITLSAETKRPGASNCNQRNTVIAPTKVAAPYVADSASGPIESVIVQNAGIPLGSLAQTSSATLSARVALTPPLEVTDDWDEPPFYLRLTTNSSQGRAVDCDNSSISGPAGAHSNFRNEIEDGCFTWYQANTRNGDCSNYTNPSDLPPPTVESNPIDDCVVTQTGVTAGQIRQALEARFGGTPCKTLNNWPTNDMMAFPDSSDPRLVTLFIVDETGFTSSGNEIYPVRNFGAFYITGGDGLGCPGDDPPPPGGRQASAWGHFVTYSIPNPDARPSDELCAFDEVGTCIAVLVD